jgi:hypothetical protein
MCDSYIWYKKRSRDPPVFGPVSGAQRFEIFGPYLVVARGKGSLLPAASYSVSMPLFARVVS